MRLFEFDTQPPIVVRVKELKSHGYKVINQGASAVIMAKDGENAIIKVGPLDDCWYAFAKKAKSTSNPHVPDIEKLEVLGHHYIAKVEKLLPVKDTFYQTGLFQCIASWLVKNAGWLNAKTVYLAKYKDDAIEQMAKNLEKERPDMIPALKLITACKGSCSLDLHPENMMRRADKTLVFNDPLTNKA